MRCVACGHTHVLGAVHFKRDGCPAASNAKASMHYFYRCTPLPAAMQQFLGLEDLGQAQLLNDEVEAPLEAS